MRMESSTSVWLSDQPLPLLLDEFSNAKKQSFRGSALYPVGGLKRPQTPAANACSRAAASKAYNSLTADTEEMIKVNRKLEVSVENNKLTFCCIVFYSRSREVTKLPGVHLQLQRDGSGFRI